MAGAARAFYRRAVDEQFRMLGRERAADFEREARRAALARLVEREPRGLFLRLAEMASRMHRVQTTARPEGGPAEARPQ